METDIDDLPGHRVHIDMIRRLLSYKYEYKSHMTFQDGIIRSHVCTDVLKFEIQ